jgi:glycosyltransferase involved in cell wall biosynthesis
MLRVATLSTLFPTAARPGFGLFVARQTLGLAAREGVSVEVVAATGVRPWTFRRDAGIDTWETLAVHRPGFVSLPGSGNARRMAHAALASVRAIAPDVIDAEFFWPDGVAAMHLSRTLGIPFTVKARGSDIAHWGKVPKVRAQMLEAAEAAGGMVAVSAALKRDMAALGMPEAKIEVHYTGVDQARFRPVPRTPGRTIVTVGNLVAVKGHGLLIEAMRLLPDAVLLVAGEGPERPALERRAGANVRFLGSVPHGEMPGLLAGADVMALASEREGLANAWVEALACGTPVVIPDVGGAREVVDRPEAGRLAERTPEAFADAIRALLDAPPEREAVRAAAVRFSWERNAAELEAHLRRVSAEGH